MSRTTKAQLETQVAELKAKAEQMEKALKEAGQVEHRSYELMFARRSKAQPDRVIANVAVALSKNGKVHSTGVIATAEWDGKKVVIRPIGGFWGFADQESLDKLARHIDYLAGYDQIPEHYKIKLHGNKPQLPGGTLVKGGRKTTEALG